MEDADYAPLDGDAAGVFARGMTAAEAALARNLDDLSGASGAAGALTALSDLGLWPRPVLPIPVCTLLGSGLSAKEHGEQLGLDEGGGEESGEGDKSQEKKGGGGGADEVHVPTVPSLQPLDKEQADARCALCRDIIDVELVATETVCPPPTDPSRSKAGQDQIPTNDECKAFSNSGASCQDATPAHKSSRERCLAMVEQAKGAFSSIKKAFKERACVCMGCCAKAGKGEGTQLGTGENSQWSGAGSEAATCFHATEPAWGFNGAEWGGVAAGDASGGVMDQDSNEAKELEGQE